MKKYHIIQRLKRSAYTPIHIRAYLQTGVVGDGAIPLDGLLFNAIMREEYGAEILQIPGRYSVPELPTDRIPIAQVNTEAKGLWYYAASWADWPEHAVEGCATWVKQFDSAMMDLISRVNLPRHLNRGSGRYRGYRMPVFYRSALYVDWYVLGLPDRISELLSTMTHIGKKRSQGWGAIRQWVVEPFPQDWSCYRDGEPMRAIPSESGPTYGIRPSYWNPVNQCSCILPQPREK